MSPGQSPRGAEVLRPKRRPDRQDSALPSKSQPCTPREEERAGRGKFHQAKPRIVARRVARCSPPRQPQGAEHLDPRPMADCPVQTRTGLTLTRPKKESPSPPLSRASSSTSLLLHPPAPGLDRSLSRSSSNLGQRRQTFSHVESKVRQYIRDVKNLPKKELSLSCDNLSPSKDKLPVPESRERPRTAEAAPRLRSYLSSQNLEKIPRFHQQRALRSVKSKSETNLLHAVDFVQSPLQISKSSISLGFGNFGKLLESSGEETDRTTRLHSKLEGEEEVTVYPEDLLALVFQERQGKQETKKVSGQ